MVPLAFWSVESKRLKERLAAAAGLAIAQTMATLAAATVAVRPEAICILAVNGVGCFVGKIDEECAILSRILCKHIANEGRVAGMGVNLTLPTGALAFLVDNSDL